MKLLDSLTSIFPDHTCEETEDYFSSRELWKKKHGELFYQKLSFNHELLVFLVTDYYNYLKIESEDQLVEVNQNKITFNDETMDYKTPEKLYKSYEHDEWLSVRSIYDIITIYEERYYDYY